MKPETRYAYTLRIEAALESLTNLLTADLSDADQALVAKQWSALEAARDKLEADGADTVTVSNALGAPERAVSALVARLRGIPEVLEPTAANEAILAKVSEAQQALLAAYQIALEANPWAEHIPVLRDLRQLADRLSVITSEISKLR